MAEPDAIARCREAVHNSDDILSVADRGDFSDLLAAYDELRDRIRSHLREAFDAGFARAVNSSRDFKQINPDRETWVAQAMERLEDGA